MVKALVFDIFGTVFDWRRSIVGELVSFGSRHGINRDWCRIADEWRQGYYDGIQDVLDGRTAWRRIDEIHYEKLLGLVSKYELSGVPDHEWVHLNQAWHRLSPWPGCAVGMRGLKQRYTIAPLSNGDTDLLRDLSNNMEWDWDTIISAEEFKSFKPDPAVYLGAVRKLKCEPQDVMLVAAHLSDLRGAKESGLRTAFVVRPDEFGDGTLRPDLTADEFVDVEAADFVDLAVKLHA